jgi:cytochrome P450
MISRTAPGPPGLAFLGNLSEFRRDVLGLLTRSRERYGDVVRFRLGPRVLHLVAHPDAIRQVLQERAALYDKETRSSGKIRDLTGLGLLTANGEMWRRQRKLVQAGFFPAAVDGFVQDMSAATAAMLERWRPYAGSGRPLDVASEMMRLTYTIVGRTLFSADVTADADEVERAVEGLLAHTYRRLESIESPPLFLPTRGNRRFKEALATLDRVVYRIISARRNGEGGRRPDLLDILLREQDEDTGERMDDPQLRSEVVTLLLAGHETTANTLTWAFYLLARDPGAMERVHEEALSVLGDRVPEPEDLPSLSYTGRVIRESMRLFPPIWAMERRAIAEDVLGGFRIPAGSTVVISPWVTHRHPSFWDEPESFDPERFTREASADRPQLAYLPFGGGPRFCIGSHFGLSEALVITAMVLRHWRLRLVPEHPVVPQPGITLRAREGIWVTLEDWPGNR